jgi:hypothetical protein
MRLCLDNCCLNRPFDEQAQLRVFMETEAKLFVQAKILDGAFEERKERFHIWREKAISCCEKSDDILTMAEKLHAKGFKALDALHVACAIHMRCDYVLTTDRHMLNKPVAEIKIANPIEFLQREVFL